MASGSKPAKRGYRKEKEFTNRFNSDAAFRYALLCAMNIKSREMYAKKGPGTSSKADVFLSSDKIEVGITMKTSESDFSQLERIWLEDLKTRLKMPSDIYDMLKECMINKIRNRNAKFILDHYKEEIISYFRNKIDLLLHELFTRGDKRITHMIVLDFQSDWYYVIPLNDIYEYIKMQPISTTAKGVLKFGDVLSMQKKGGDGEHVSIPKDDFCHPGNQFQFKINPLSLVKNMGITSLKI
jgi:hypothetical protein